VAKASVSEQIIPISIVILVVLFLAQGFGTSKLAFLFGPVSFIWFLLLAGTGVYNITTHPAVFRAFDPSRAVMRQWSSIFSYIALTPACSLRPHGKL
jgi:KUP system potassium uptake protein